MVSWGAMCGPLPTCDSMRHPEQNSKKNRHVHLKTILLFSTALLLSALTLGCENPGEKEARLTVERFIAAMIDEDPETAGTYAPFVQELEEKKIERLYREFQSYENWRIKDFEAGGSRAEVPVEFRSDEKSIVIRFPLEAKGDSWRIRDRISFSTTIDFIPAE